MRESPLPAQRARAQLAGAIAFVDGVSTWVGRASAWLIAVLTVLIAYEVFSRYVLGSPHDWAFDASYMLYGSMFMLAGAYALAKGAHVRGDLLYGSFPPRLQAALDLVLYLLFFLPGITALAFAGYTFAAESWAIREGSPMTPDGPPVYPFKAVIPIAGGLLLLQGLVEILRCFACVASGEWPARAPDVEEVNLERLKETVDVTGEARR
jgi:TRAP-type mannitol/chloroaromatic compound transport system permease small subunit